MCKRLRLKVILVVASSLLAVSALAGVFVDWRGGFHVTYPDNWRVVPYSEVSSFLENQGLDVISIDYDAVLAEAESEPFQSGAYVFVALHETGALSNRQIDSVLKSVAEVQFLTISEGALDAAASLSKDRLIFDRNRQAAASYSDIKTATTDKAYLELRKFYEKGVAIFLCYAPRERFSSLKPVFFNLLETFSTKNLREMAPQENLKIVDLATRERLASPTTENEPPAAGEGLNKESGNKSIYIIILAIVLAGIVLVIRLKKKITPSGSVR
ncbi:MAG: hypothetical protein HRF51_06700 [bacterium]|jgi:hypothetical protein